jgi:hypothetical protein
MGALSETIAFSNVANNPEPFITLKSYGSYVPLNEEVFTVTVSVLELFLIVVRGETSPPGELPINNTVAPVVSNRVPVITIVAILEVPCKNVLIVAAPPFTVKAVIEGGASTDFHSVPV